MSRTLDVSLPFAAAETHDFDAVYAEHAAFVWRSLRALGVPAAALDDALQDTFVVVHQKLASFRAEAQLRTWLFAIARRVASHHRRAVAKAARSVAVDEQVPAAGGTFEEASRNEAAALVVAVLDELDDAKRELIVLVELEQIAITEVAAYLGVPLNTAYSRVRLARKAFAAALARRKGAR